MRRYVNAVLAAMAIAAGVVLLVWRWRVNHTALPAVAAGVLVLGGIPAIWWLVYHVPVDRSRRLPASVWAGAVLAVVGAVSVALFGTVGSGGRVGAGVASIGASGQPHAHMVRVRRIPAALNSAVNAVLPGTHVAYAFANAAYPKATNWEVLIGNGRRLVAEANWDGSSLTFSNMAWNTYLSRKPAALRYTVAALEREIQLPPHAVVWGPYQLPGYFVLVVVHPAQVWEVNLVTGEISGGNG